MTNASPDIADFSERDRIASVAVDEAVAPPQELEQERRVAIFDLVEESKFRVRGVEGPHHLIAARAEGDTPGYAFSVSSDASTAPRQFLVTDPALEEAATDYLALCDAYRDAVRHLPPSQIERADAERRALHTEASEILRAALDGEVATDAATARRLFTLCCTLSGKMERLL